MQKKKNTAIFIDGENIPARKADIIMKEAVKRGVIDTVKVYGLQNDKSTSQWSDVAKSTKSMKDIRLCGEPARNKVDKKIKRDMLHDIRKTSSLDIVIIASSDHGYADQIRALRAMGKRVVVFGEAKAPEKLRRACNEFVVI